MTLALKSLQRKKLNKLKQGLKIEIMPVKPQTMETIWKTLCKYNIYPRPKLQFEEGYRLLVDMWKNELVKCFKYIMIRCVQSTVSTLSASIKKNQLFPFSVLHSVFYGNISSSLQLA